MSRRPKIKDYQSTITWKSLSYLTWERGGLYSNACGQRVDTIKREMFSQKSLRRFVSDSSAFVMGAMFLASALNRGISPGISTIFKYFWGVIAFV